MNFAQVLAIYQAGDTAKAVKIWQQEVEQSAWTGEEKRLAYQYLLAAYPPTTPEHHYWRWQLACCLEELKLWPQALELFYQDESLARLGTALHHIWHCQICLGQLSAAAKTATKLLVYYWRTKKIMPGLAFLAELKQTNFSAAEHLSFQIKFWQLQGDLANIAKAIAAIKNPADLVRHLNNIAAESVLLDVKLANFGPALEKLLGPLKEDALSSVAPADSTGATKSHSFSATIVELHRLGSAPAKARGETPKNNSPAALDRSTLREVLERCREFMKTSYLKILFYPTDYHIWPQLIRYAQQLARPKLLGALKNLVDQAPIGDAQMHTEMQSMLAKVAPALVVAEEIAPAETIVGPCDMATDLFLQELTVADLKAARIKRMERDIAFLTQQGEKTKAQAILHALKEIDEDNTMAYQADPTAVHDSALAQAGLGKTPSLSKVKTPEEILAYLDERVEFQGASPLLASPPPIPSGGSPEKETWAVSNEEDANTHRASVYDLAPSTAAAASSSFPSSSSSSSSTVSAIRRARQDLSAEYRFQERYFQLYLKYLEVDELLPIYRDLIYAWRALGMARPGLGLLEKIQQWRQAQTAQKHAVFSTADDLRLMAVQIQDIYLQAILLGDIGEYFTAIDLLEGQLRFAPLQKEEQVCFYYLLGEYYMAVDNLALAHQAFKKVLRLDKHYRLVQLRMKELEA